MPVVTDDERRTIATGLRHTTCDWTGMGWELYLPFVGLSIPGDRDKLRDAANRLADLIDPDESVPGEVCEIEGMGEGEPLPPIVDREALLALADEMETDGVDCYMVSTQYVLDDYARRIREACGEVDA